MSEREFRIRFRGSETDEEHVRLPEFVKQLEAVYSALNHTEELVTQSRQHAVFYRVTDLSHSSPATVAIEAVSSDPASDVASMVVSKFLGGLRSILTDNRIPKDFDRRTLESYKGLTSALKRNLSEMTFLQGDTKLSVTTRLEHSIDHLIGPDILYMGSIKGQIESVNIHNKSRFSIYPAIGPTKVECRFSDDLFPVVKEALSRQVIVRGTQHFKALDPFPYAITVEELEIYPEEDQLPSLWDLKGRAPRFTGDMDSVSFVRASRDAQQ